ncbi:MAG: DUF1343 domain-containing protein [Gemmatimonadota bacterium]
MRPQSGIFRPARAVLAVGTALIALTACTAPGDGAEPPSEIRASPSEPRQGVRPGIEVLVSDSLHLVRGRRVGVVTNHPGIDSVGVSSMDRVAVHPVGELVALFSPEHDIRGTTEAGVQVPDETDRRTGLPVHSLYGATLAPTPDMLEGVEVLVFDVQDIGTRYYTYVYTMALAMEAAGEAGLPFVVLDRPNPIGGRQVQGNVLDPEFASFVGRYPIPMRHGMTPGELARLFRAEFGVEAVLHVVPLDGWTRGMLFSDTGLPWRPPSPNMPDLESALHYPGTCLFEGTNLSVGRGTDRAFQWIGAPWIDAEALARAVRDRDLPGVRVRPARFVPRNPGDGKFDGEPVEGIRLEVTDPDRYDPTRTAVALLLAARGLSGDHWRWNDEHFDRLAGTQALRLGVEGGETLERLMESWADQRQEFERLRQAHLIYP